MEGSVIVWVALSISAGLALLALRSMAYAFTHSVVSEIEIERTTRHHARNQVAEQRDSHLSSGEATILIVEILLSIGIALVTVGLASMAALPGRLTIGALLAQIAVLGALIAPPVTVQVAGLRVRPAAIAMVVAQLANLVFFIHAIRALL
jgi:hypothetical protein